MTAAKPSGYDCVVIGGGISGLAAALRLQSSCQLQGGRGVLLLEGAARVGGALSTEHHHQCLVEAGPDSFLSRKPRGVGLCRELGLDSHLCGRRLECRGAFIRRGIRLHPLPEGMSGLVPLDEAGLANSRLLSEVGRRRFANEVNIPMAPTAADGSSEDESVGAFVRRRFGDEACDFLVEPLLSGIYAGDIERMSLRATFPQLRTAEREAGSVLVGLRQAAERASRTAASVTTVAPGPFLSLRGGLQMLVDAALDWLANPPQGSRVVVQTGRRATSLRSEVGQWRVATEDGEVRADRLVVATPPNVAAQLLAEAAPGAAEQLAAIPAASTAVVTVACREGDTNADAVGASRLGYGWLVPSCEGSEAVAVSVSSNKWPGRAPVGTALYRVFVGRWPSESPASSRAAAELEETALAELQRAGIATPPDWMRVHRWPAALPQYLVGHQQRLASLRQHLSRQPGLALAGAYLGGVGIPDCITSGERAADAVIAYR